MIITESFNSYRFYHRGYVCSVGSASKLSLDTYSKSKRTTPRFGKWMQRYRLIMRKAKKQCKEWLIEICLGFDKITGMFRYVTRLVSCEGETQCDSEMAAISSFKGR